MSNKLNRVSEALFSGDTKVVNVKFFPGDTRVVTAEQLTDQLERADAQLRAGTIARTTSLDGGLTPVAV